MQQACDPDKKPAWHNEFWTIFLDRDELVDLQLAHVRMATARREDDVRGKIPEL
jgi:hypothetical protein